MRKGRNRKNHTWSPPSRWSGLKSSPMTGCRTGRIVSTLAVEWIEIMTTQGFKDGITVSTLAVEWIEIQKQTVITVGLIVSTLAVEWIEISASGGVTTSNKSPPSRWSGLKLLHFPRPLPHSASPPSRWSGLKYIREPAVTVRCLSPPSRWSGLKFTSWSTCQHLYSLHPRGGVD